MDLLRIAKVKSLNMQNLNRSIVQNICKNLFRKDYEVSRLINKLDKTKKIWPHTGDIKRHTFRPCLNISLFSGIYKPTKLTIHPQRVSRIWSISNLKCLVCKIKTGAKK